MLCPNFEPALIALRWLSEEKTQDGFTSIFNLNQSPEEEALNSEINKKTLQSFVNEFFRKK